MNEATIYDTFKSSRSRPTTGILVLVIGVVMLVWYVRGIGDAVRGDIHNFIPAFRSAPLLTVAFAFLKLAAYVFFPALFGLIIYVPLRNLWLKQVVVGTLETFSVRTVKENKRLLLVKLDGNTVSLRATDGLTDCLNQCAIGSDKLRVTVGAFQTALRVEKIA